jgi:hypothetical protein
VLERVEPDGRVTRYRDVRFVPEAPAVRGHLLREGERLDHVAHLHLRDTEAFWALCDANLAPWAADLEARVGSRIKIPARRR